MLRVASAHQAVAARRARERSQPEPAWGLHEGREGALVGLRRPQPDAGGGVGPGDLVVEMEMRRRSGRAVAGNFVLVRQQQQQRHTPPPSGGAAAGGGDGGSVWEEKRGFAVVLMSEHPEFRAPVVEEDAGEEGRGGEGEMETTFDLGLTEKQRRDREGVVLPYFDAQVDVGGGEGGRILYEMGREDDFDEEEDEI